MKPVNKPNNPCFSSGPCAKRPGWNLEAIANALVGRSHRSKPGKERLAEVINLTRKILGIPADYRIGIVPASDTGAIEMAMWSMLGAKGVDVFAWESFGSDWVNDIEKQLKISDLRVFKAPYGSLPDLSQYDGARDCVFTWNGTTSGVKVPDASWIPDNRTGLTFADSTSAVFAMELPWSKLDVVTYSWQKVLGGEGAHGMLILSPRAVERLETYKPERPLPKIFRMSSGGKLSEGIFKGETINTPSMICVEDALDGLKWSESIGGLRGLITRSQNNLKAIEAWVAKTPWVGFLAADARIRSNTSVCLTITDSGFVALGDDEKQAVIKKMVAVLESEGAAYDIASYRDAPAGLRIWAGATVEQADLELLFPWLEYAWESAR